MTCCCSLSQAGQCVVSDPEGEGVALRACDVHALKIWAIDMAVGPGWLVSGGKPGGFLKINMAGASGALHPCSENAAIKLGVEPEERGKTRQVRAQC